MEIAIDCKISLEVGEQKPSTTLNINVYGQQLKQIKVPVLLLLFLTYVPSSHIKTVPVNLNEEQSPLKKNRLLDKKGGENTEEFAFPLSLVIKPDDNVTKELELVLHSLLQASAHKYLSVQSTAK